MKSKERNQKNTGETPMPPDVSKQNLIITTELKITQRDLPHWQIGGTSYFITFRLNGYFGKQHKKIFHVNQPIVSLFSIMKNPGGIGVSPVKPLSPHECTIVKDAILLWHKQKWIVEALTVMPDHAHIIATPMEISRDKWFSLSELMHSVKSFTSHEIQRGRKRRGKLWQSESFDRIIRTQEEFEEKFNYILENAMRAGLVKDGWDYEWFWCPGKEELESSGKD